MTLSFSPTLSTGFFVTTPTTEHNVSVVNPQPTKPDNVEPSGEDNMTLEKSTADELMSEGDMPKGGDLEEDQSEVKSLPNVVSKAEDSNSENVCTIEVTSDSSTLETNTPGDHNSAAETIPVLSDNPGDHSVTEESTVNSQDTVEVPPAPLDNSKDQEATSLSPTLKETNPVDDSTVETPISFSPISPTFILSGEDSLPSSPTTYEKPEDDPDGIASMLHLRKESIKGEEMIPMQNLANSDSDDKCVITIISRRSRHRAG